MNAMALERTTDMGGGMDPVPMTAAQLDAACGSAIRFLRDAGRTVFTIDPADLETSVENIRHELIDMGVACCTFLPDQLQGYTAAGAADIAWDAAQRALKQTTFECLIAWKDTPGFADRSISLVPCQYDANGDPIDDEEDSFFYFDGTQSEAEIRLAYNKENSPEDWYIAADDAVIIAALAAELGLTDGGAK
jgi:hypothetical protein